MTPSIAEIMQKVPGAFRPEMAQGIDVVVHFKFTGIEAGEWNAIIRDGEIQVAQGIPRSKPGLTVSADSSDIQRLASGELDPTTAVMSGTLKVSGDAGMAQRVMHFFRFG